MVPTPVALRRVLSWVPTPIALRRVHSFWFRFRHTQIWVWAPLAASIFMWGATPPVTQKKHARARNQAGGKIRNQNQKCRIREQNQKWPTSGQIGYLTPAVSGSPTASERGAKSEVAHRSPAVSGSPTASERGAKSEVAHKWAKWLPHPCRIGEPHRFRAGGKIRSGPQVGKLATSPLPYRGAPPLQSGEQSQKWPTSGQIGYLTPAVSGSPTASERGAESEVAHK